MVRNTHISLKHDAGLYHIEYLYLLCDEIQQRCQSHNPIKMASTVGTNMLMIC